MSISKENGETWEAGLLGNNFEVGSYYHMLRWETAMVWGQHLQLYHNFLSPSSTTSYLLPFYLLLYLSLTLLLLLLYLPLTLDGKDDIALN